MAELASLPSKVYCRPLHIFEPVDCALCVSWLDRLFLHQGMGGWVYCEYSLVRCRPGICGIWHTFYARRGCNPRRRTRWGREMRTPMPPSTLLCFLSDDSRLKLLVTWLSCLVASIAGASAIQLGIEARYVV